MLIPCLCNVNTSYAYTLTMQIKTGEKRTNSLVNINSHLLLDILYPKVHP